jgi:hypothetical protein
MARTDAAGGVLAAGLSLAQEAGEPRTREAPAAGVDEVVAHGVGDPTDPVGIGCERPRELGIDRSEAIELAGGVRQSEESRERDGDAYFDSRGLECRVDVACEVDPACRIVTAGRIDNNCGRGLGRERDRCHRCETKRGKECGVTPLTERALIAYSAPGGAHVTRAGVDE